MDVELYTLDVRLGFAGDVQLVAVEIELGQFSLERFCVDAEVDHRTKEHVAADAAKNIEIENGQRFTKMPWP